MAANNGCPQPGCGRVGTSTWSMARRGACPTPRKTKRFILSPTHSKKASASPSPAWSCCSAWPPPWSRAWRWGPTPARRPVKTRSCVNCWGGLPVTLLQELGIDFVVRLHQRRDADFRRGHRLGEGDHVVTWMRPERPDWMDEATYERMPASIRVREVHVQI